MRRHVRPRSIAGLWDWRAVARYLGHDAPESEAARKWVRRQVLEENLPLAERDGCAPRFDPAEVEAWAARRPQGTWSWQDVAEFLGHAEPTTEAARKWLAYQIKHHGLPTAGRTFNRPTFDPAAVTRWKRRREQPRRKRRQPKPACPLQAAMETLQHRAKERKR